MPWTNYHSHTHYCDGSHAPDDYAAQASAQGLLAYGFSSHAPLPFECAWSLKPAAFDAYQARVRELQRSYTPGLQIYCGLEVDFIPGVTGPRHPRILALNLDYTIGSVHFVDAFPDGQRWEIDGPHLVFLRGLAEIFAGDIRRVVSRYFELTRQMVREQCPDVVGHLDKIKIQDEEGALFSETATWYRDEVEQTLQIIAEAGVAVEVNTRGIYKKKAKETYPGRRLLERMHQLRIPVMINSDAHHPSELTACFSETAQMLRAVGYRELRVLLDGRWQDVPFSEEGLMVSNTRH